MFWKKKDTLSVEILNKKISNLSFEIEELYRQFKLQQNSLSSLEIDVRFLQTKFKDKIFTKKTEQTDTNIKPSVFLNPYGNPI